MNRKPTILWYIALIALALAAGSFVVQMPKPNLFARVSMLDVGQGDSFLIEAKNGKKLLIDGGQNEKVLTELGKILSPGDRTIDVVIATHPDADHIGGLSLVLSRYKVGLFLTTQATSDSEIFKTLMHAIDNRHVPAYFARRGMTIALGPDTTFSILFPDRDTSGWETNTASVVGKLQIGNTTALFTGDSPVNIELFLAAAIPKEIDVDIVKLGHHGSKTSSSEQFLTRTSPTLALISAGINNKYGHPMKEIIDRLTMLGIHYVSTQDVGTYALQSDGEQWYKK